MCAHPFQINQPISADRRVQPEDILRTKQALNRLGYYKSQYGLDGGWVDNDMFSGIRQLQKDNGLKVDGIINPDGATQIKINQLLTHSETANDNERHSNDNGDDPEVQIALSTCDSMYAKDSTVCRKLKSRPCWASAADRYGACIANRPIPPLFRR